MKNQDTTKKTISTETPETEAHTPTTYDITEEEMTMNNTTKKTDKKNPTRKSSTVRKSTINPTTKKEEEKNMTTDTTIPTTIKEENNMTTNTTTTNRTQTITLELMAKINELTANGMELEAALFQVLTEAETKIQARPQVGTQKRDHIAYIESLKNLPEIRRVRKVAYAKISKSKGKEEAIARYHKEVDAATAKLNELLAEIDRSETPWLKAKEFGEDKDSQLNYWVRQQEELLEDKLEARAKKGLTKAQIKAKVTEAKVDLSVVPEELRATAQDRISRKDMRVQTVIKKMAVVNEAK